MLTARTVLSGDVLRIVLIGAAVAAAITLTACGGDGDSSSRKVRVVATTSQLGDFARQVGGDAVKVDVLVKPGADPHDFEPRPSDVSAVSKADVVLISGAGIDDWLYDVLDNAGGDARQVLLADLVEMKDGDPHWWQDPNNAIAAVSKITVELARAAPEGRDAIEQRGRDYTGRVRELDAEIERCVEPVPQQRRTLVTTHDAFGYLADRYNLRVLGSVIPGTRTSAQPSAGDVRRLVRAIEREDVSTIFPEAALNQRLEKAIADEAGAKVGPPLYADTLGPKGSEGATYLGALRHDAFAVARGFGARCPAPG